MNSLSLMALFHSRRAREQDTRMPEGEAWNPEQAEEEE